MNTSDHGAGLLPSLRGLLSSGLALVRNRLELLGVELQEEKARLLGLLAYGAAAFLLLSAATVFFAIFLTVVFWDSHRLLALGLFTGVFAGGGIVALLVAFRLARASSSLFSASLSELARDRAGLDAGE